MTPGIRCEGLPRPRGRHTRRGQGGRAERPSWFTTPARLSGDELTQDFCASCHRGNEEFAILQKMEINNVRFQPYRIFHSKCYSDDKRISCTACHDPHEPLKQEAALLRREVPGLPRDEGPRPAAARTQAQAQHGSTLVCQVARRTASHATCRRSGRRRRTSNSRTITFASLSPTRSTRIKYLLVRLIEDPEVCDIFLWLLFWPRRSSPYRSSRGQGAAKTSAPVIAGNSPVVFAEVEPAQSKITWAHDNARSEARHLPETCGGGGALLRLRQRRLDGHLPRQQRPVGFLPAEDAAQERALPQQPRRHVHRRDGQGGRRRRHASAWARRRPTYDGDGWQDLYVTSYGPQHPLPQQRQRHVHRRDREGGRRRAGLVNAARPGSTTTTTASSTSSSRASSSTAARGTILCGDNRLGRRYYCVPRVFKPTPEPALPQQRRRHVRGREQRVGHRRRARQSRSARSRLTSTTTG